MNELFEKFTYQNANLVGLRQYNQGYVFNLENEIALVMDGVVSVETVANVGDDDFIPTVVRLVGKKGFLNLETVINPDSGDNQQFVVESKKAIISFVRTAHLKAALEIGDQEGRVRLYSNIVESLVEQINDVTETASWLSTCSAEEKIGWALRRLEQYYPDAEEKISRIRIAAHTGVNLTTVSKIISRMRKNGTLSQYGERFIRTKRKA